MGTCIFALILTSFPTDLSLETTRCTRGIFLMLQYMWSVSLRWNSVCCPATAWDVPVQAEFPTFPRLLWDKGLPTWTNENIFHRQHGCYGKQHIFTVKRSGFYDSTGQVRREGKLHQEFTQSCHVASPYCRKKQTKKNNTDSTTLCLNVNGNKHTPC